MRKAFVLIALLGLSPVTSVWSQDGYPNRPLRLVLSVPPGGAADYIGRIVGGKLSEFLAQNIVIESRPGVLITVQLGSLSAWQRPVRQGRHRCRSLRPQ